MNEHLEKVKEMLKIGFASPLDQRKAKNEIVNAYNITKEKIKRKVIDQFKDEGTRADFIFGLPAYVHFWNEKHDKVYCVFPELQKEVHEIFKHQLIVKNSPIIAQKRVLTPEQKILLKVDECLKGAKTTEGLDVSHVFNNLFHVKLIVHATETGFRRLFFVDGIKIPFRDLMQEFSFMNEIKQNNKRNLRIQVLPLNLRDKIQREISIKITTFEVDIKFVNEVPFLKKQGVNKEGTYFAGNAQEVRNGKPFGNGKRTRIFDAIEKRTEYLQSCFDKMQEDLEKRYR